MEVSTNRDIFIHRENIYTSHKSLSIKLPEKQVARTSPLSISDSENRLDAGISSKKLCILVTAFIYFYFFCTGLNAVSVGTTLVHMGYIYQANTQMMSLAAVCLNFGYILGAFLSGILFDRFNEVVQLTVTIPVMAVCVIVTPWMPNIYLFYVAVTCSNFIQGYLHAGCASFTLALWADHRFKQPVFQGLTTLRCIGSFVFPFICIPFLADMQYTGDHGFILDNSSVSTTEDLDLDWPTSDMFDSIEHSNGTSLTAYTTSYHYIEGLHKVRYTFVIIGGFLVINFLLFATLLPLQKSKLLLQKYRPKAFAIPNEDSSSTIERSKGHKISIIVMFILTLAFSLFFFPYEYMIGSMLYTFAFSGLVFSGQKASLLTSLFYGMQCLGRVIALIISAFTPISKILFGNVTLTLVGLVTMMFVPLNVNVVWVATGIIGVFVSSTIPSVHLLLSNYLTVTGPISSALFVTAAISSMAAMALGGYLYQHFGHMSVMYLSLGSSVINTLIYVTMVALSKVLNRWKSNTL